MGTDSLVCQRALECVLLSVCMSATSVLVGGGDAHTHSTGRPSANAAAQFVSVTDDE